MKGMFRWPILAIGMISLLLVACQEEDNSYVDRIDDPALLRMCMENLSDVIVYDIFSPPVASRIYAYPSVACFEIMAKEDERFQSLAGQLTDFQGVSDPAEGQEVLMKLAALQAFNILGDWLRDFLDPRLRS